MALTDKNEPWRHTFQIANASAHEELPVEVSGQLRPAARRALERLPELHAEISQTAHLARLLRAAVGAGAALTGLGALAVTVAGGASLQQEFVWSVLVLAGVGAMLRCYIRSTARAFDRSPLHEAAKDLRVILFYAGFAWGAGAFLLLGNDPVPALGLCFAMLPTLLLTVLLRDRAACLAFLLPVTFLSAVAIILQPWNDRPVALAMLLVVQGSMAAALLLSGRTVPGQRPPAGLSLR